MSKKLVYYREQKVTALDFKGVKEVVVPKQCMSLKEILIRFTKKQSLPVEHEGYHANVGVDLEKASRADFVDRDETREQLDKFTKKAIRRREKLDADEAAERDRAKGSQAPPPSEQDPPPKT